MALTFVVLSEVDYKMPLYKLFCIAAHYPEYMHIKDLVSSSAKLLLDHGSAVREIRYLGPRQLPQRMRRHGNYHSVGDYWTMHFDAPPSLLLQLSERLRTDHRVVRWTTLKVGERLSDVAQGTVQRTVCIDNELSEFSSKSRSPNAFANLGGDVGTGASGIAGKVAGLDIGNDLVATLGGTGYARERI